MRYLENRCKRTPCYPMVLKWPQAWVKGHLTTPLSGNAQNLIHDNVSGRRPRSRLSRPIYRSRQSNSSSPVKRVLHVKSLSPGMEGTLSPPLCNSPDRYRSSSINKSLNNMLLDMPLMADADHGDAAYFSSRPPSEPIHLIFTSPNGCILENEVSDKNSLDTCSSSKNIYSRTKFSSKPPVKFFEKSSPRKLRKMVRRLLRNFIQHLPLNDVAEESIVPTSGTTTMIVEPEIEQRSVSTQAFTPSTTVSVGNCNELGSDTEKVVVKKKPGSREWKGGLRALRDSHLRILMRQLRHLRYIERLDRSLKRS